MTQSKKMSAVESCANISAGAGIALLTQLIVFPLFDMHPPLRDNLAIMGIFTVVSFIRSYFLRRMFNVIKHLDFFFTRVFGLSFGDIRFNNGKPYMSYHIGWIVFRRWI